MARGFFNETGLPILSRRLDPQSTEFVEVLGFTGKRQGTSNIWKCKCKRCGKEFETRASRIANLKSCGCHARTKEKLAALLAIQHKDSPRWRVRFPSEFGIYYAARHRCMNPNNVFYHRYGGRGIEFRFKSFGEFINYIGPRPSEQHSLDRIDPDGNYEIGNLRWATAKEQVNNRICRCTCEECKEFRAQKYKSKTPI